MDVIIKSFNRPYYLERCIRSIHRYLSGEYRIVILDDGTSQAYLNNIQRLFPTVVIFDSGRRQNKVPGHHSIPTQFWIEHIERSTEIFLLLEEDAWLTAPVDIALVETTMIKNNIATVKLFWGGHPDVVKGEKISIGTEIEEIRPDLPLANGLLARMLVGNQFHFRTVLTKTGVIKPTWIIPYYSLYTVASAFFQKKYWLALWKDAGSSVNEGMQLLRALQEQMSGKIRYAKTTTQKINTSYITSSTNVFQDVRFDFDRFNQIMSEAWLKNNLDPLNHFPHDFPLAYLEKFLPEDYCCKEQWHTWISLFKKQYLSLGFKIEH